MTAEQVKSEDIKHFLGRFETQRLEEAYYHLGRPGPWSKRAFEMALGLKREVGLKRELLGLKRELEMSETGIRTKAEKKLAELEEALKAYELNHRRMRTALEFILAGDPNLPGEAKRMQSRAAVALRRVSGKKLEG